MIPQLFRRRLLAGSTLLLAGVLPARAANPGTLVPHTPEAAMLARTIGPNVVLLNIGNSAANNAVRDIMRRALDFGRVKAQTANGLAVMERTGVAMRLEQDGSAPSAGADAEAYARNIAGGYVGGDIDLRFNFDAWRHAFAVTQPAGDGAVSRSLQFFDAQGNAVHKLFLTNEAAGGLFDLLAQDFRAPDQQRPLALAAPEEKVEKAEKPDSAVDLRQFRQAWLAMADPGQFSAIIAEFGVTREQALRLAPAGMALPLAPQALRLLLDEAARHQLPLMVFVGNAGVTQIYTGTIAGAIADGTGYVAQASGFSLHLRDSALRSGYVVQRAGATSVEFFGADGEPVVTFIGVRDRAKPLAWGELVRRLAGQPPGLPPAKP